MKTKKSLVPLQDIFTSNSTVSSLSSTMSSNEGNILNLESDNFQSLGTSSNPNHEISGQSNSNLSFNNNSSSGSTILSEVYVFIVIYISIENLYYSF